MVEAEVAENEAREVGLEVMEVACQAEEVVGLLQGVAQQAGETSGWSAAVSFPAFVQGE